jgi:hypothetical protein
VAKPYSAPMPDEVELGGSYTIRITAVDPSTGNVISAITISNLVMMVNTGAGTSPVDLGFGPFLLVPGPGG